MKSKIKPGRFVLMGLGIFMVTMILLGQTGALINYDFVVSLKLQESQEIVTPIGVAMNKGLGFGDTLIYAPLLLSGLIGLKRRSQWGVIVFAGAMGITAYWPIMHLAFFYYAKGAPGFNFTNFELYTWVLLSVALYGIWGLWYLIRYQKELVAPDA